MDLNRLIDDYENSELEYYLKIKDLFLTIGFSFRIEDGSIDSLFKYIDFYENASFKTTGYLAVPIFIDDEIEFSLFDKSKKVIIKIKDKIFSSPYAGTLYEKDRISLTESIFTELLPDKNSVVITVRLIKSGESRNKFEKFLDENLLNFLSFESFNKKWKDVSYLSTLEEKVFNQSYPFRFYDFGLKDLLALKIFYFHTITKGSIKYLSDNQLSHLSSKNFLAKDAMKKFKKIRRSQNLFYAALKKKKILGRFNNYTNVTYL